MWVASDWCPSGKSVSAKLRVFGVAGRRAQGVVLEVARPMRTATVTAWLRHWGLAMRDAVCSEAVFDAAEEPRQSSDALIAARCSADHARCCSGTREGVSWRFVSERSSLRLVNNAQRSAQCGEIRDV